MSQVWKAYFEPALRDHRARPDVRQDVGDRPRRGLRLPGPVGLAHVRGQPRTLATEDRSSSTCRSALATTRTGLRVAMTRSSPDCSSYFTSRAHASLLMP